MIHPKKFAATAAVVLAIGFTAPTFASAQDTAPAETTQDTAAAETTGDTAAAETTGDTAAAESTAESVADTAATEETTAESTAASELKDIVDTAAEAGNFTTLTKLLTDAELVDTLKGEGPFTVFAPTDEAFAKIDAATLESLASDKALLTKVLTYHVVPGKVLSSDITPGKVATVNGADLDITVDGSTVKVNDATVTTADIEASNGVIHVIDTVLLPPADAPAEEATTETAADAGETTESTTEDATVETEAPPAGDAKTGSETALVAAGSLGLVALAFGLRTAGKRVKG